MTSAPGIDNEKLAGFMIKVSEGLSATMVMQLCIIGDRLSLFKDLAEQGSATHVEFAARNHIHERYALEWLSAMAAAQYVDYDPSTGAFTLPPEHAAVLADEGGPMFMSGIFEMMPALSSAIEQITTAFRTGGGVPKSHYDEYYWSGMERCSIRWYNHQMLREWVHRLPAVEAKLNKGGLGADIGCSRGQALIKLAQAFPNSRFVGFDIYGPNLDAARTSAEEAGVADRTEFRLVEAAGGLASETYDLILCADALHEFTDVPGTLKAVRSALAPDGVFLLQEVNMAGSLEENINPWGAMFYSASVLFCLPDNLHGGGEGLGRLGLHDRKVRELCADAGFSRVGRLWEDKVNVAFDIRP